MTITVGIPRALFYHDYAALWDTFFNCLGFTVTVSAETDKLTVDLGAAGVVDEVCLPVKIYFGHVARLARQKPDYLFVPRLVSIERAAFICPKLMGLPDMLMASGFRLPAIIQPTLNLVSAGREGAFLREMGRQLYINHWAIERAWRQAKRKQRLYEEGRLAEGAKILSSNSLAKKGKPKILLLGHAYMLGDSYLNLNLPEKLKQFDCQILSPGQIGRDVQDEYLKRLPKAMFWTYGRILLGSAFWFSALPGQKGVIILSSFGCGIDSFVVNMVMRHLRRVNIPCLNLPLDGHSGAAGLETRVEAFFDMLLCRRQEYESYFPAYGQLLGGPEGTVRTARSYGGNAAADE